MSKNRARKASQQTRIQLQVKPFAHQEIPSLTGSAISNQAGTVLYGYYSTDYCLPNGDSLRFLSNHDKSTLQIILLTHDPNKIKNLPGDRPASLVANTISHLNRYLVRSESYPKPLSTAQQKKYLVAQQGVQALCQFLGEERQLQVTDWVEQESLRKKIITIVEKCRDENRLLANNPIVSEGILGDILYETKQMVQHYEFNRLYPVSYIDQLDFTQETREKNPYYVWDSELHVGHNEHALDDALRVICREYGLEPAKHLINVPANRFKRLERFFSKLWTGARDWATYLALPDKPSHSKSTDTRSDGLTITHINPHYRLEGLSQQGYSSLNSLINHYTQEKGREFSADSFKQAHKILTIRSNGNWVKIRDKNQVIIRLHDELISLLYFEEHGKFYPLPSGEDLYTLSQLSKTHLYLPERISLRIRAFFSKIPLFFKFIYQNLYQFITHELHDDVSKYLHETHDRITKEAQIDLPKEIPSYLKSVQDVLISHGILATGETLEEFVERKIAASQYVIAREQHIPSPPAYTNPLHRTLGVARHFAAFFINASERNPIVGLLALIVYIYGAGAIIAPHTLAALLTKLHLKGLIYGIKPTQALGRWMSHGTTSEAISAATTYWQGTIIAGNMDSFFIEAITLLKDDPAEVAIIVALALGLGYGLCKAIPPLQEEMGIFPLPNYAALGAKGGAAIYDTIMHPGDDWFLGTIKWLMRGVVTAGKVLMGPFVEGYYYGYSGGFVPGCKKSFRLLVHTGQQICVAIVDLFLALITIPLLEISALFIHVPFRGVTNFLSKLLGALGEWEPIGQSLINFATRSTGWNFLPGFRSSPLYGFSSPFGQYAHNKFLNGLCNAFMLFFFPAWQVVKNFLLLPISDVVFFSARVILTCVNPVVRLAAFGLGKILTASSDVWDNTIGAVLRFAAYAVSKGSNWADTEAGEVKQSLLGEIQVWRRGLYHWAFEQEEIPRHQVNTDKDYFLHHPWRLEQVPHDTTHCLLKVLLTPSSETGSTEIPACPQFKSPFLAANKAESVAVGAESGLSFVQ